MILGIGRCSPINIVTTESVVAREEELLNGDDDDDINDEETAEVESVKTEKSTNDGDEEIDVDVEECSSTDDGPVSSVNNVTGRKYRISNTTSKKAQQQRRTTCNSDELKNIDCHLETKELWDKFNELGTEMIITKTGR